jgi:hypothetical protein
MNVEPVRPVHNENKLHITRRSLALSKVFVVIATCLPLLAAAGWIFNIEVLTRIHPTLPAMQPNTILPELANRGGHPGIG